MPWSLEQPSARSERGSNKNGGKEKEGICCSAVALWCSLLMSNSLGWTKTRIGRNGFARMILFSSMIVEMGILQKKILSTNVVGIH